MTPYIAYVKQLYLYVLQLCQISHEYDGDYYNIYDIGTAVRSVMVYIIFKMIIIQSLGLRITITIVVVHVNVMVSVCVCGHTSDAGNYSSLINNNL